MPSAVVGLLRVLLTANTAEFTSGLKAAANQMQAFSREMGATGRQMTSVGTALTKSFTLPLLAIGAGSAKLAMDFESSFAGVRKTVDATEGEFAKLSQGFRDMAKTIPVNVNELNKIGEAAGALGIKKDDILEFTSVMAQLGVTTNLTSDQAATSIAQIQNIFNASGKDTKNFASALVALGNAGASTEREIVEFATRLAGAGHQIGLTQQSVLGFSSALANMGLNAELGGTALSTVMSRISVAVDTGGKKLEGFAKIAGMTGDAFRTLFKADPTEAILRFTEGLGRAGTSGENLTIILKELGLKGANVQDVMKRLAGGADQMRNAVELSTTAWRENSALTEEARKRFETTESQLKLLWGRIQDVGITIGNSLLPAIKSLVGAFTIIIPVLEKLAGAFAAIPGPFQAMIAGFFALGAAAGPALFVFGQLTTSAASVAAAFGKKGIATKLLVAAFGTVAPAATGAAAGVGLLGSAVALLTSPVVLITAALGLLAFGIYKVATAETDLEKAARENAVAFKAQTDQFDKALSTYERLHEKTDRTIQETKDLDAATRFLAESSGLSVDAFNREWDASGKLRAELEQLRLEKQRLSKQNVDDARASAVAAQAKLATAQAELRLLESGRTQKIEVAAGPTGKVDVQTRAFTAAERQREAERLKANIEALTTAATNTRAAFEKLAEPVSTDETNSAFVNMAKNLRNVKADGTAAGDALSEKFDALDDKVKDADAAIAGLSATIRTRLIASIKGQKGTDQELADAAGLTLFAFKRFEEQLKANTKEGTKHQKSLASQAKSATELASSMSTLTASQIAQIEALLDGEAAEADIAKSLKVTKKQINEVQAAQKARIKEEEDAYEDRKKISLGQIKLIGDHLDAFSDAKEKEMEAEENAQERLMQAGMAGAALKIRQLEVQRDAEIRAHKESKAAIDAFYDYEIKIALETADTIEERMRRAGVRKKADYAAQLKVEQEFYAFMLRNSSQFTEADIRNQKGRVRAAEIAAGQIVKVWGESVTEIGGILSRLGGMFDSAFGRALSGIGSLVTSFGQATTSIEKYKEAVANGTATTMQGAIAYSNMGMALITYLQVVSKFLDRNTLTAKRVKDALASHGGSWVTFRTEAAMAGQSLDRLFNTRNVKTFERELRLVEQAIADQKELMDRYNLTWRDFGQGIRQSGINQAVRTLATDFRKLTAQGVSADRAVEAMSGSLNQLIIDAVATGTKIPVALQPIIEKLIRMGGLTEEAARAMLGLAADTMPSLADITAAADRYGLKLDDLGSKVKQLSINEAAQQIVKDFDLLMRAGVPLEALMKAIPSGFREQVQKLITDALQLGLTLPASMKPMLEILLKAGGLTDEFGNKLESLEGLTFAESIQESVDRLIGKLDELIDHLSGVGDEFERTANRARGAAEVIGHAIPRVPDSGAPPPPPPAPGGGEDTGEIAVPRALGGLVPQYAAAGARVLKFIPRGTDTVPVMATPGEYVLNTRATRTIGTETLNALNAGQTSSLVNASTAPQGQPITNVTFARGAFEGVVVDSTERIEELANAIPEVIRRGGSTLTKWQNLPLVKGA
jgi:TP901 family phage tail tape measure protein